MQRVLKQEQFQLTINQSFEEVIASCAAVKRSKQRGTWITSGMKKAYIALHDQGHALSAEAWDGKKLVGGLYGVVLGNIFCGESMFSLQSNASKAAFIHLVKNSNFRLIDCQVHTAHLESLGAEMISREEYLEYL